MLGNHLISNKKKPVINESDNAMRKGVALLRGNTINSEASLFQSRFS